jgi:GR25 family glycosyltransferase involved in LPS biosynthesis
MKAFIISLSKIDSSFESAKHVHRKLVEYGFTAELFEGTYGNEAVALFKQEHRKPAQYGIKTIQSTDDTDEIITQRSEINNDELSKLMRPGVLGCFYSHYRLWQKCVELNESIFIFEDDVIFERKYIPIEWEDVLMVCTGKEAFRHRYYSPMLYEPTGEPKAVSVRNTSMPGAVGYGLTPHGALKLVNAYKKETLPADTAMNQFVVKLECHNYLMGRAAIEEDGKISLTSSKLWGKK